MKHTDSDTELYISDEVLCRSAQDGGADAESALVARYTRMVRALSRPFFLTGGDSEDLIQEGMLGLIGAVREYDPARGPFRAFAALCVRRRIYSAIRRAQGQKHSLLNRALSLEQAAGSFPSPNPESLVIGQEEAARMTQAVHERLSRFELQVLSLYLKGQSYAEMAQLLRRPVKSVDNAVQRIRRKLAGLLDSPS